MNEAQRQSYLKAMGLTPWVARVALPGAAPSPALDWPEEEQANAPASAGPAVDVAVPSREPESAPVDAPLAAAESSPAEHAPEASAADALAKAPSARSVAPAQEQAKEEAPAPAKAKVKGLTFTLEAHLGGTTWLLCAQEDLSLIHI